MSDYLQQIEHLTWAVIWRIRAQTTSQNQEKHVPSDLCSTPPRLAWGHQADSLSEKRSKLWGTIDWLYETEETISALD